ncbi:ABC transporter permease [Ancylomarina sp. 16SWW S1-10-2]|uniref:ABC transporter permease n=1 Tax=Ancylomarina sp. 16SWW S1-10-2 TaxID=2499681 RepID=UPI0012ADFFAB|nr:ABC transporter permease [Ancylomarina sp. 16SWW S1-10-2]MRT94350.1 FtsX-like permease family protein [Ancylomarina sp. 16SWW S1-10-2]
MILNQILKNKKWYGINTLGIGLAFAVTLIIFTFAQKELSYDNFHSNADDIYRITIQNPQSIGLPPISGIDGKLVLSLYDNFPEIKEIVRIIHPDNTIITANKNKFSSDGLIFTNKQFFKVFDFKLLQGNRKVLFDQPNQVVISKKTALAYFGTEDAIGKEIKIEVQYLYSKSGSYTVVGVMENFPDNSHFKADLLFSIKDNEDISNFETYTYLLLQKGSNLASLKKLINAQWGKNTKEGEPEPISQLMPLRDIHLYSHNTDELSMNGSITSVIILIIGGFIVFLIAFINYTNLNYVQFVTDLKNYKIRMINGASHSDLARIIFTRSLIPISFAILLGGLLAYKFDSISGSAFNLSFSGFNMLWITFVFYLIFALSSLLPLVTTKVSKNLARSPYQGSKKFVASLLFQFTLSIAAIILTIVLHKQIDLVNDLHPGNEKSSIIIMQEVPYPMIQKYEVLKESCLKHPEIRNISAAFYKPGLNMPFSSPVEMEGVDKSVEKKLNLFSIESDFFKIFDIKPLAGTLEMGITSSIEWERLAMGINDMNPNHEATRKVFDKYTKEHPGFQEKYILNQSALKVLGIQKPEDAIGKSFKYNFEAPEVFKKGKVIAVIGDLHYGDMFSKEKPMVMAAKKMFNSTFIAKIDPNRKAEALKILKKEWDVLSPDNPFKYEFVDDLYERIYMNQYKEMRTLTLFSIIAIILSILGMFALSSFSIQHKTKEIGIRKANGSTSFQILILLIKEYTQWVLVAFLIACPIAYYIAKDWLSNFAYRIELSWWIFALSGLIALIIAILTVSWQTWKAATQNPVEALQYE